MTLKFRFFGILALAMLTSFSTPMQKKKEKKEVLENWKLAKNEKGIQIFTRNRGTGNIKEFRAIGNFKGDINGFIKVLKDVNKYPEWIMNCKLAKTLKKVSESERYDYWELSMPFPMQNRDVIIHVTTSMDNVKKMYHVNIKCSPTYIPPTPEIIRLEKSDGFWELTQSSATDVHIEYQMISDPGGNVPDWVVNMFIVEVPFQTITNLKDRVLKLK